MSELDSRQRSYCQEVLRFRKALNLTSVDTMEGLMASFVRPSVMLQQWIPEGSVLLDIGSGMGVPGIPLLIARPDTRGILVDRRMKRTEFLRHVVRKLRLCSAVYCCDVRRLTADHPADVVVARAVTNPSELLMISAPLVKQGGVAILPTAQNQPLLEVDGWCALGSSELQFGEEWRQQVLRYRRL